MYILNKIIKQPTYCLTIDEMYCDSQYVIIDNLKRAKTNVTACIYKFNNIDILVELENVLERKVNVKMIMDYENNFNTKITKKLISLGADIMFWKPNEKLHAKFFIIDNHVFTGSFNLTSSKKHKVDLIVTLSDETSCNNFHTLFNKLHKELINK